MLGHRNLNVMINIFHLRHLGISSSADVISKVQLSSLNVLLLLHRHWNLPGKLVAEYEKKKLVLSNRFK